MGPAILAAGAVVALLLLELFGVLVRSRAESRRALAAAHAETEALRERLDALAARLEAPRPEHPVGLGTAYVITDAGASTDVTPVPDRLVLSATLGEPLVKVVAFGHGVRRALSAETRNRIRFEVRREVRRTRKQRRREMKDAWRRVQAEERAA